MIKMLSDLSQVLSHYDLNKYYQNFEGQKINEIVETFKLDCNTIKSYMSDNKLDNESILLLIYQHLADLSEIEDNYTKYNSRRQSEVNMKQSYKVMNNKVVLLKKLEFEFTNIAVSC